jgi:hypothetical protein
MLKYSQTRVILPIVTLSLLKVYAKHGKTVFSDSQIRVAYASAVRELKRLQKSHRSPLT